MICKCEAPMEMELAAGYVNHKPDDVGQVFAFELYVCIRCGRVARESTMSKPGVVWITIEGTITHESATV